MPRVSIQDIAKACAVSKSAVSMALRGHPRISRERRDEIRRMAAEMGYRPDPAIARIASCRWKHHRADPGAILGYLTMPHPHGGAPGDRVREAAEEAAAAMGYRLNRFDIAESGGAAKTAHTLRARGIEGVLVDPMFDRDLKDHFPWEHFVAVAVYEGHTEMPCDVVTPDYAQAFNAAWSRMRSLRWKRIGLALYGEGSDTTMNATYKACRLKRLADESALEGAPPVLEITPDRIGEIPAWVEKHRIDAVLGFSDAVYWWLRQAGREAPGFCGYASLHSDGALTGRIAGMRSPCATLTDFAVRLLDLRLRTCQFGLQASRWVHRVATEWSDGPTLPPAPASVSKARSGSPRR